MFLVLEGSEEKITTLEGFDLPTEWQKLAAFRPLQKIQQYISLSVCLQIFATKTVRLQFFARKKTCICKFWRQKTRVCKFSRQKRRICKFSQQKGDICICVNRDKT